MHQTGARPSVGPCLTEWLANSNNLAVLKVTHQLTRGQHLTWTAHTWGKYIC